MFDWHRRSHWNSSNLSRSGVRRQGARINAATLAWQPFSEMACGSASQAISSSLAKALKRFSR